jgi:hypothetical protein
MKKSIFVAMLAAWAGVSVGWVPQQVLAQGKGKTKEKASTKQYPPVPRAADGKPDMTGVWQYGTGRIGKWEEVNNNGGFGGAGGEPTPNPVEPAREQLSYQPWAAEKVLESYNRRAIDDPIARCLLPGVPRATSLSGLFPMQIVQSPKQVIFLYEVFHAYRVVPIASEHPDDVVPSYMGDSIAKWDGDTLVVDTIGLNDETWIGATGTFHSDQMHVTERYKRADYNTIQYEAVIDDPKVLTKPWTQRSTIMLREGTRLREYECLQNNEDLQHYEKLLKDESVFRRK